MAKKADAWAYLPVCVMGVCIPVLREKCLLGYSTTQNIKLHLQINKQSIAIRFYLQGK